MANNPSETIGDRLRALKGQIKEQTGVRVTDRDIAAAAGVHPKTPTLWQMRKPPKGKSKVQEPTDENLAGIVRLAADYGVDTSVPRLRYGMAVMSSGPPAPEEITRLSKEVREAVAEIDERRAVGAPVSEISRLQDKLAGALNAGVDATKYSTEQQRQWLRAVVGHLTSRSEPRRRDGKKRS